MTTRSSGFTLVELMLVIAIIAALMGLSLPLFGMVRNGARAKSTASLVQALAGAIATHPRGTTLRLDSGGTRYLWDFNADGILDGDPARDDHFDAAARNQAQAASYSGPAAMLGVAIPAAHLDAQGRIIDGWKRPLRLRHSPDYGPIGVGVWSCGKDGASGTADDVTSWSRP